MSGGKVKVKLTEFLGEASIHGLNRVADTRRNFIERLIWLICISSCLIYSGILIHEEWQDWNDNPVLTTIDETTRPATMIPFPSGKLNFFQIWTTHFTSSTRNIHAEIKKQNSFYSTNVKTFFF